MNYWKPVAIVSLCAATALGWLQYGNMKAGTGSAPSGASPASSGQAAGQSAQRGGQNQRGQNRGGGWGGRGGGRPPALVVAQPVREALINDRLRAVGSGTAKASVSVVPLSSGVLREIQVSAGDYVEKGAVLARLDDQEQRIARDRSAKTVENAAIEEARLRKLFRSQTATEAELIRVRATLADARLALRDAELTLARREITAPIAGFVGLIAVDEGNYITPQTEIVTIDDRSTIVLEFWVPERFADQLTLGASLEATAQSNPANVFEGIISGIGSRVETDSRTLPVRAELDNNNDALRPGMAFNITLRFSGESYPAVNPLAIQWDSKGAYVWALDESKVQRVPVQIIQRNPESVLVAAELEVGSKVVTEGLLSLRSGASVREQGAARGRTSGGTGAQTDAGRKNERQGGRQSGEKVDKRQAENADPVSQAGARDRRQGANDGLANRQSGERKDGQGNEVVREGQSS